MSVHEVFELRTGLELKVWVASQPVSSVPPDLPKRVGCIRPLAVPLFVPREALVDLDPDGVIQAVARGVGVLQTAACVLDPLSESRLVSFTQWDTGTLRGCHGAK